jgi:hypothetical protein
MMLDELQIDKSAEEIFKSNHFELKSNHFELTRSFRPNPRSGGAIAATPQPEKLGELL